MTTSIISPEGINSNITTGVAASLPVGASTEASLLALSNKIPSSIMVGVQSSIPVVVDFSDSHVDAFSRLRVSHPFSVINAQHHYGNMHYNFVPILASGGTITDVPNTSSITLATTATVGSNVINRSRRAFYVSGQSHLVCMTGNFQTAGNVNIVLRTSTSGTPSDTNSIPQTSWNIDKMNGTGPSGITIDWTKIQIFWIDMQWLGAGRVRVGLDVNGAFFPVHQFQNANALNQVYMQTANLPCSYECSTLAGSLIRKRIGYNDNDDRVFFEQTTTGTTGTLMQICSAVFTEGTIPQSQVRRTVSTDITPTTAGLNTLTHLISIRPAALFKTRPNKCMAIPIEIEIFNSGPTNGNSLHYHILEDSVLLTPTWVAQGAVDSMMEYCITTGGFTTLGRTRDEGYVAPAGKGGPAGISDDLTYVMQIDPANAPDVLSIAVEGLGGTTPCFAKISWYEYH